MRSTITINVPEQMRSELDKIARADGISLSEIGRESLRDYLLVRRFRTIRNSMLPKPSRLSIYTDEDVFNQVS